MNNLERLTKYIQNKIEIESDAYLRTYYSLILKVSLSAHNEQEAHRYILCLLAGIIHGVVESEKIEDKTDVLKATGDILCILGNIDPWAQVKNENQFKETI